MYTRGFLVLLIIGNLSYFIAIYYLFAPSRASTKPVDPRKPCVHIIGKAAIAEYLWLHILGGSLNSTYNGFFKTGLLEAGRLTLRYLSGPGFIQTTIPQDIEYLVVVLNGMSPVKRRVASEWLNYLKNFKNLLRVAVVLLGDEQCRNDWILEHMKIQGGRIDVLFVVYDWDRVDNEHIYQWPLGVATYRGFPLTDESDVNLHPRQHQCNFIGTIYENSSRSRLKSIIEADNSPRKCVSVMRQSWQENETKESLSRYINVLNNSDYTLCPVGKNTECYRIYEALSMGSTPIVEDVMTLGRCTSPLRLLKKMKAPIIYVKSWEGIRSVLKELESKRSEAGPNYSDSATWYLKFKDSMKATFLRVLTEKFRL